MKYNNVSLGNENTIFAKHNAAILPDYSNVCAYFLDGSAGCIISE